MFISIVFSATLYQISSSEIGQSLGRQTRILRELQGNMPLSNPMQDFDSLRTQQLEASNSHLKTNLIYLNLLILVLSSGASYFLARKSMRPIEEMMEAQNHFTADASHELKTPLTVMKTEIEVGLRDKKTNLSDMKKMLVSNLEEINKLEVLSNALLNLSRYQNDNKKDFKNLSISEIVTEAFEKIEKLAEKKGIHFNNKLEDVKISGDKKSLVELFVILLENAIKYSDTKSTVSIKIGHEDNKFAVVQIADRGIGIKKSDIPFIFNRFYRADQSRCKEKCEGYGLGLSIAKSIIDLHNGQISVVSTPGEGSEFTIKLPL